MRTKTEITNSAGNWSNGRGDEYPDANRKMMAILIEVLTDIRDLLANPPTKH